MLQPLVDRIRRETVMYRKGEAVTTKQVGVVEVTDIYMMDATPPRYVVVDVHFVNIGFTEAAADPDGFLADLTDAFGSGEFHDMTEEEFRGGPSYITTGAWLGSQDLALALLGLGAHYGYWRVITPAALGITGPEADVFAGNGLVMNGGFTREPVSA